MIQGSRIRFKVVLVNQSQYTTLQMIRSCSLGLSWQSVSGSMWMLSWGQCIYVSEVVRFANYVVETHVTQSSFEPNCLFSVKRDVD